MGLVWTFEVPSIGLADKLRQEKYPFIYGRLQYSTVFKFMAGSLKVRVRGVGLVKDEALGVVEGVDRQSFTIGQHHRPGSWIEVEYIKDDIQ